MSDVGQLIDQFADSLRKTLRRTHTTTAIVGAAVLEAKLSGVLKARLELLGNSTGARKVESKSFAGKIKLVAEKGLIDPDMQGKLNAVREVRNLFAHSPNTLTFESTAIGALLQAQLSPGEHKDNESIFLSLLHRIDSHLAHEGGKQTA